MKYTANDIVFKNGSYKTKDGKFSSHADSGSYSYWYDENIKLGHTSYDYFFALDKKSAIKSAVTLLNRLIQKYNL